MTLDRTKVWTGTIQRAGARPAASLARRPLRHDAARRGADGRRRADARGEARDRAGPRRRGARPDRGGVPAGVRGRLRGGRGDRRGRPQGRGLGFSRAVQADVEALVELGVSVGDREPDLGREARGPSRLPGDDARADPGAVSFATEHGIRVAFFGVDSSRARTNSSTERTRRPSRPAQRRSSSSTRSGSRPPRLRRSSCRVPSTASTSRPLAWPRRLRARHSRSDRRSPGRGDLGAGDGQRDGRARRERRPAEVALALEALYGTRPGST